MLYFSKRLAIFFRSRVLDLRAASNLLDRLLQRRARGAAGFQDAAEFAAIVAGREHEQFAGNELVAALLSQLVGDVEQLVEIVADQHLAGRSFHFRHAIERSAEFGPQLCDIGTGFLQQRTGGTALLIEQCRHQMRRLDVLIIAADGERLGIGQSRLKFGRQLVHSHESTFRVARNSP